MKHSGPYVICLVSLIMKCIVNSYHSRQYLPELSIFSSTPHSPHMGKVDFHPILQAFGKYLPCARNYMGKHFEDKG